MNNDVISMLLQSKWAILPTAYEEIMSMALSAMHSPELLAAAQNKKSNTSLQRFDVIGKTAVIPVEGPIYSTENIFTILFGGCAISTLAVDFETAMQDKSIERIVLQFDSPGGVINGVSEMAKRILAARSQKKIEAYVYGMACSAAYWLASATSKIVMSDTAQVGSIGVVAGYVDTKKRDEAAGYQKISIVSSQSPKKNLDVTTDAGKVEIQKVVDALADVFVKAVATNRGTSESNVIKSYGQGGIVIGKHAVSIGMADEVNTLNGVLSGTAGAFSLSHKNNVTAELNNTSSEQQFHLGTNIPLSIQPTGNYSLPDNQKKVTMQDEEEEQKAIANIIAGANAMLPKEPEKITDEERMRRFKLNQSNRHW